MSSQHDLSTLKAATRLIPKPRRALNLSTLHFGNGSLIFSLLLFSFPSTWAANYDNTTAVDLATGFFTDLAPLLSLFGTEFSKQFMSQAIDWVDDFLFAMAPLGILTIVIGAIRVSGYTTLRALVGKAREPESVSEIEFLSSTSPDVCETWDKRGVTRKLNNQSINAVLYDDTPGHQDVLDMWEAEFTDQSKTRPYITRRDPKWNPFTVPEDPEETRLWNLMPPNLTLNAHAPIDDHVPIQFFAALGFVVQAGAIVFQAVVVYHLQWLKDGARVAPWAFPLTCAGELMVCLGTFLCAQAIERRTQKVVWIPAERTKLEKKTLKLLWVQQGQQKKISDSYAILRDGGKDAVAGEFRPIWGSYRRGKLRDIGILNIEVAFGTFFSLCGFLLQLTGLRALHFSAAMAQVIAILIMTVVRCYVRRGLAKLPEVIPLQNEFELDQVALLIAGLKSFRPGPRFFYWKEIDGNKPQ